MTGAKNSRPWQGGFANITEENITSKRETYKRRAWLEAGFPGWAAEDLRAVPELVSAWLEDCERSEAAVRRQRPIPGLRTRRGRIYAEY